MNIIMGVNPFNEALLLEIVLVSEKMRSYTVPTSIRRTCGRLK